MKQLNMILMLTIILIVISPIAYSEKIITQSSTLGELEIIYPKISHYKQNTNITLYFHVYNSTGRLLRNDTTDCYIHIYDNFGMHFIQHNLGFDSNNIDFKIELTDKNTSRIGRYPYLVYCNDSLSGIGGYVSTEFFINPSGVEAQESLVPLAFMLLIPLVLSFIAIIGAATLGEDHNVFRIFLFLFSMIPFIVSMHMSMIIAVNFFYIEELENLIGDTMYWFILIFIAIIFYFIFYWIAKLFHHIAGKREERLNY